MSGALRLIAFLLSLIASLIGGCGGGRGSTEVSNPHPPTPPSPPRNTPLEFGYYGNVDGELAATADHISFVFTEDWGDWSLADYDTFRIGQIIAQLQEAKARGIAHAWIMCGFLVFDSAFNVRPDAIARLHAFKMQLQALGLFDMVKALYPVDEPDAIANLSDASLVALLQAMKTEWPDVYMAVFYSSGHNQLKGITAYDLIGLDDYDAGAGALDRLPMIRPDQKWLVIPGGADPWRQDPTPFLQFALARNQVYAIVPFLYADRGTIKGIGDNGMLPAYRSAGCSATHKC